MPYNWRLDAEWKWVCLQTIFQAHWAKTSACEYGSRHQHHWKSRAKRKDTEHDSIFVMEKKARILYKSVDDVTDTIEYIMKIEKDRPVEAFWIIIL